MHRTTTALTTALVTVGLLMLPVIGSPAQAAVERAPSLTMSARNLGTVVLSGRTAHRRDALVLQRRTSSGRWVRVRFLASRSHRFRVVVWKRPRAVAHRIVDRSSRRHSVVRRVPRLRVTRDACGVRPLKASGEPWRCSFQDGFGGSALDTRKWTIQDDGYITGDPPGALACYRSSNVRVAAGSLRLTARPATLLECPGLTGVLKVFTSGMVSTHRKWSQRYGRFQARIHTTATDAPGLHEAYWLWPDDRYGAVNGDEIDVSETYSVYPSLSIPYLHHDGDAMGSLTSGRHQNTAYDCVARRGRWNTYTMVWGPSRIRILVNGRDCLTYTGGDAAFRKRYIMMFTQALGSGTNAYSLLDPPPMPATMRVDYARVWR